MSADDSASTGVARLAALLADTNDWLRFAEGKNAALVALPLALFFAFAQFFDWDTPASTWSIGRWYAVLVLGQFLGAAIASLVSFAPRTNLGRLIPQGERSDSDNLLYFGHVAKYSPRFLVTAVRELEGLTAGSPSALEQSYAEQVVVNGRITVWKFHCAKWSIRLLLSSLVTPLGVWLLERRLGEDGQ